jgi:TonB family protein
VRIGNFGTVHNVTSLSMKAETPTVRESPPELSLLLLDSTPQTPSRLLAGEALASIAINLVLLFVIAALSGIQGTPAPPLAQALDRRKSVPLVVPLELTQKAPNHGEVAKQMTLDELLPKPEVRAAKRIFSPPPAPPPARQQQPAPIPTPEPPQIKMAEAPPPAFGTAPNLPPPPAPPQPPRSQEKPKLAFETPGIPGTAPNPNPSGLGRIGPPKSSVDEAIRSVTRGGPGGVVIGDAPPETGIGQTLGQTPVPGRQASQLELLSDPQGIDFKPYLIRVLAAVRRNWFAVIPESAHYGRRGKVTIQFSISRAGSVPKLVIVMPSGTEALDRAAVAGISASNPFPPLPAEFRGDQIRVQLSFFYNASSR